MSTEHTALRWALYAMLADTSYADPWLQRDGVEAHLQEGGWPPGVVHALRVVAIRWAHHCDPRQALALRKALGETLTEEEAAVLSSPAKLPSTRITRTSTLPLQGEATMIHDTDQDVTPEQDPTMETHEVYSTTALERLVQIEHHILEMQKTYHFSDHMRNYAVQLVQEDKVHRVGETADVWAVQGSEPAPYQVNNVGCTCKANTNSNKTKWSCAHIVAVALAKRLERGAPPAPIPTQTLDMVALAAEPHSERAVYHTEDLTPAALDQRRGLTRADLQPEALSGGRSPAHEECLEKPPQSAHNATIVPQEVPEAMPEPEAILETSTQPNEALGTESPTAEPEAPASPLTTWGEQRKVLAAFIREHLKEGVDYGKVHFASKEKCPNFDKARTCREAGHWSKDTLFKSGGEKFCGLMRLRAVFRKDEDTWEMLGRPPGVLCLVCELVAPGGEVVGEGRGCRDIKKDYGDVNKSIKMAQKSSQLDAVLRTGCLSDVYTLDLDDEPEKPDTRADVKPDTSPPPPAPVATPPNLTYQALSTEIMAVLKRDGFAGTTREAIAAEVFNRTGLALIRENYEAILAALVTAVGVL
jgi:hypothetical protein